MSIPTIGIEKFFQYHSEIRMRTIDVALSADLNDRVKGYEKFQQNLNRGFQFNVPKNGEISSSR